MCSRSSDPCFVFSSGSVNSGLNGAGALGWGAGFVGRGAVFALAVGAGAGTLGAAVAVGVGAVVADGLALTATTGSAVGVAAIDTADDGVSAAAVGFVVGAVAGIVVAAGVGEATPRPRAKRIAPELSSETIKPMATAEAYALDRALAAGRGVGAEGVAGAGEGEVEKCILRDEIGVRDEGDNPPGFCTGSVAS